MTFFPWTTHREDVSDSVPYIGDLRLPEDISWRQALVNRLQRHGFPTEESRRYLHNFCFVYCLPRELQSDADLHINSDNEDMEDPLLQALAYCQLANRERQSQRERERERVRERERESEREREREKKI
jgi:uncharacterized UBP type Zn finger protein